MHLQHPTVIRDEQQIGSEISSRRHGDMLLYGSLIIQESFKSEIRRRTIYIFLKGTVRLTILEGAGTDNDTEFQMVILVTQPSLVECSK
jgi:hypothetical protein